MTVDRRKELFPNVSDNEWNDWQWQVRNRIETVEQLKKYIPLTPEEEKGAEEGLKALNSILSFSY